MIHFECGAIDRSAFFAYPIICGMSLQNYNLPKREKVGDLFPLELFDEVGQVGHTSPPHFV